MGDGKILVANSQIQLPTIGLYTPEQAARLARLRTGTFKRWIDGNASGEAALDRMMPHSESGVVSFVDFVQAMAIRAIRRERKLSLQKIRETVVEANRRGVQHPFARKHQTFLFNEDVVVKLDGGELIQVTGKYKDQQLIRPVVELYMDDLVYDDVDGLACRYTAWRDGDRSIVIDPKVKYGAPVVYPSGFTVGALLSAVDGEGSPSAAAEAFEIDEKDVKIALRYDDWLSGTAA